MLNLPSYFEVRRRIRTWWNGHFGPLPQPEKWVFIVGCYNSGTTLLHDLLAVHPNIGCMPDEGQFYTNELLLPQSVGLPRLWALDEDRFRMNEDSTYPINLERLKRQWGARYNNPDLPVLIEKSPTNAGRTRWLQAHFENAHFIGIIRNGYAVAEGIHRKAGHSLVMAATQWSTSNAIMLEDFEYLRHRMLLRYEELTDDPDETLLRVYQFLNVIPPEISVKKKRWVIHERTSKIRNMNSDSLSHLSLDQRDTIENVAGVMLQRLGYIFEK